MTLRQRVKELETALDELKPTLKFLLEATENLCSVVERTKDYIQPPLIKVMLDEDAYEPIRAHDQDVGYDLRSPETVLIPGVDIFHYDEPCAFIDTGVHVQLPVNTGAFVKGRSSMNKAGITTDGVIDPGYTGSIKVKLWNHGKDSYLINKGDKIAQLVILDCKRPDVIIVNSLDDSERGEGGFGSTGK